MNEMIYDLDSPKEFDKLTERKKQQLCEWIRNNIFPRKTINNYYTSYGLKHYFENYNFYITNGTFKGAMLKCGFQPGNRNEKNWVFRIKKLDSKLKQL